ncbi:DNA-binding transcriptional MerR regulator [Peptoniphilus koenoeneniae]|uniref:DNA-binding transcriptional MerR regulator n=1 Tax=Peptoniphilus koenoeneniae TaxID=507751 RepID=A0ABU0AVZ3_9FIRM|nr:MULTISPECIES: MerR family transcriptional regulator [Peptoniphilus]ERT59463.1 MerR HTH family regulatory protein [Peptoniphilus sp. BV3C26]MDQ0274623.1 DNA-binding transcriptional MerR regulator [Peptoniphilus koenoeneniae]
MLINEIAKKTELTRKAIEYYIEKNLIKPEILDNGYRNFSKEDQEKLVKIKYFRDLDFSVTEIQKILQGDKNILRKIAVERELEIKNDLRKKEIISKLESQDSILDFKKEIEGISAREKIIDKLTKLFPGYYGDYLKLYFGQFLNEKIESEEEKEAFYTLIDFLDSMEEIKIPEDLKEYMNFISKDISKDQIKKSLENYKSAIENSEEFLNENKEVLKIYEDYKNSLEYKNSKEKKLMDTFKEFNKKSGYYEIFIPAMRKLSKSYNEFYEKILIANEKFLKSKNKI